MDSNSFHSYLSFFHSELKHEFLLTSVKYCSTTILYEVVETWIQEYLGNLGDITQLFSFIQDILHKLPLQPISLQNRFLFSVVEAMTILADTVGYVD